MHYAKVDTPAPVEVVNADGARLRIGPGEINGVVNIEGFVDSRRQIGKEHGYLEVAFGFADSSGYACAYNNVLSPWALWPCDPIRPRPAQGDFKKHVTLKTLLDTRDTAPIRYTDGGELINRHKYNDVTFEVREEERCLAVRLTVYVGDLVSMKEHAYRSMDYEVPLDRLLWRRAPKCSEDDVMPEAEDYVPIRLIGGDLVKGITPSPIIVRAPGDRGEA